MKRERAAYRVIPEKSDPATGLHYVACPLCGADQPRALLTSRDYYNNLSGEFGVVRCRECGFTYTNPRPFGARLAAYYPDSAAYYNATTRPEPRALQAALETGSMRRRLRRLGYPAAAAAPASVAGLPYRILKYAIPPAVGGGAALEVGCAAGGFLYQLQCLGWTCRGLELNQAAAEHARSVLGLHVTAAPFETAELPAASFDAVVMRMVLEHLPAPVEALLRLNRALRPGGRLIFSVPNFDAPELKLFGRYAYILHVPQHLSHFTPATARAMLRQTGFDVERLCLFAAPQDFWGSLENRRHDFGAADWGVRLARRRWVRRLVYPVWRTRVGLFSSPSRMLIYARKPS
jgi:SAM-dependent methyltransferase